MAKTNVWDKAITLCGQIKPIEFDGFRKQAELNSFTLDGRAWPDRSIVQRVVA